MPGDPRKLSDLLSYSPAGQGLTDALGTGVDPRAVAARQAQVAQQTSGVAATAQETDGIRQRLAELRAVGLSQEDALGTLQDLGEIPADVAAALQAVPNAVAATQGQAAPQAGVRQRLEQLRAQGVPQRQAIAMLAEQGLIDPRFAQAASGIAGAVDEVL